MKHYYHDHFNAVQHLPEGEDKSQQLRIVSSIIRGNIHWFVRRLLGNPNDEAYSVWKDQMDRQSDFVRTMRNL